MKVLIAITSHVLGILDGSNKAIRETFARDIPQFPELDYKFFVGDGTPTSEDESYLFKSIETPEFAPYKAKSLSLLKAPKTSMPILLDDEVALQVPDDYIHMPYKTRAKLRWATARNYDVVLHTCIDTFVHVPRFMASGFETREYSGDTGVRDGLRFVGGGGGMVLGRSAYSAIARETEPIKQWAEDWWISTVLHKHYIAAVHDPRHGKIGGPWPEKANRLMTAHLYDTESNRGVPYDPQLMHQAYKRSRS